VVTVQSTAAFTITQISSTSKPGPSIWRRARRKGLSPVGDVFVISPSSDAGRVRRSVFRVQPRRVDTTTIAIYHFDGVSLVFLVVTGQVLTTLPNGFDRSRAKPN